MSYNPSKPASASVMRCCKTLFLLFFVFTIASWAEEKVHALALNTTPKYPADFAHFDYVNPAAPKGGVVVTDALGTFDSLNPFALKGNVADGLGMVFETLSTKSDDEPFTEYGLLAQFMELDKNHRWIIFHLHPDAKFHDGESVDADDVVFSFQTLIGLQNPTFKRYYADVDKVEALDSKRVKFHFKHADNPELPLILGQLTVLPKHWWEKRDPDKAFLDQPLGSGPYVVKEWELGKSITYERAENYWGKDLPVNRGRYNFDYIRYDYYRDRSVGLEAFKAGEYDYRLENTAKSWATLYRGEMFDKSWVKKEEITHQNPAGMQGFVMNVRRALFSDVRVREALGYAFDFTWTNKNLFYGQYQRSTSYFANSELASSGEPSSEEVKLLRSLGEAIPENVFTEPFELPQTDGSGNIRQNLRKAARLLKQAGWNVKNGSLTKNGQPFSFEILLVLPDFERIVLPYKKNLEQLGITVNIRTVDTSQYINRMREFDFDMVVGSIPQSLSPGNEQRYFFQSSSADTPGSRNYAGIKNPAIDKLIDLIVTAPTRQDLITRCRAMDRLLLWNYYVIPHWHINTYRIAYWDKFARPTVQPPYALGFENWWIDPEKQQALFQAKPSLKRR